MTGYVPGDESTDRGTALLDALRFWRKQGIDRQTVRAFVEVDPRDIENVKRTIDWFGCAYLGVELPDAVLPTSPTLPPWTCSPDGSQAKRPNPHNGHCVIYCGDNATGPVAVTWGTTVQCLVGLPRGVLRRALRAARALLAAGRLARADQPSVPRRGARRRPAGDRRVNAHPFSRARRIIVKAKVKAALKVLGRAFVVGAVGGVGTFLTDNGLPANLH